jgi:hypothetical protein
MLSARNEQLGQPASQLGSNMRGPTSVLAIDEENEVEADCHEDVAQHDAPDGNGGPPEAMIEGGHDEERDESK